MDLLSRTLGEFMARHLSVKAWPSWPTQPAFEDVVLPMEALDYIGIFPMDDGRFAVEGAMEYRDASARTVVLDTALDVFNYLVLACRPWVDVEW